MAQPGDDRRSLRAARDTKWRTLLPLETRDPAEPDDEDDDDAGASIYGADEDDDVEEDDSE